MALPYKSTRRSARVQLPEEDFKMGMSWTDAPLTSGFNKMLVNFDFKDNGQSLIPRIGIRAFEVGIQAPHYHGDPTLDGYHPAWKDAYTLVDGRVAPQLDGSEYRQIIISDTTDSTAVPNSELVSGKLYNATIAPFGVQQPTSEAEVPDTMVNVDSLDTTFLALTPNTEVAYFKRPTNAEIHGIKVDPASPHTAHIGTFAFGNDYYYFGDTVGAPALKYTAFDETKKNYIPHTITPRALTPKEAVMWGYNMLASNPYQFENQRTGVALQLLGFLPYKDGYMCMTPQVNQTITYKCNYTGPAGTYVVVWEWKEPAATDWVKIKEEDLIIPGVGTLPELSVSFSSPREDIMLRCTATVQGQSSPTQVMTVGFNFAKEDYGTLANISAATYDLSKATGMCYWANRLVLYGVPGAKEMLFTSDINDPTYFPFPNGADNFEEAVLYANTFLNDLLIWTTTKLYLLKLSPDGLAWNKTCIQENLNIRPWDIHLILPVKNMVFFKSGNYYFMVVPQKTTGGLVIAPVAKSIERFFDTFDTSIEELLKTMYNYTGTRKLVHYYNFLDFEDVHNVYVFELNDGLYVNIVLLYNTLLRNWRIHVYESQSILRPYRQDATQKGILMSLSSFNQDMLITDSAYAYNMDSLIIQFHQYTPYQWDEYYIPQAAGLDAEKTLEENFEILHTYKNHQVLDTGYREQSSDLKKRYREVQLKFNNTSAQRLEFYTDFLLDADVRRNMNQYIPEVVDDPENPGLKLLVLTRKLVDPTVLPGSTVLAEDKNDLNCWTLDESSFADQAFWKVRIPISGKGYAPRMRVVSFNEAGYELLNYSWVYRQMYAR